MHTKFGWKTSRKNPLRRVTRGWEDILKADLRKIAREDAK
jgi:hypothetical protein